MKTTPTQKNLYELVSLFSPRWKLRQAYDNSDHFLRENFKVPTVMIDTNNTVTVWIHRHKIAKK